MSYTAKQWRAINWIVKREKLVPQLSAWPNVQFLRQDGTILEERISTIVDWYDNARAIEKREASELARYQRKAMR